jgi:hypothetical protein
MQLKAVRLGFNFYFRRSAVKNFLVLLTLGVTFASCRTASNNSGDASNLDAKVADEKPAPWQQKNVEELTKHMTFRLYFEPLTMIPQDGECAPSRLNFKYKLYSRPMTYKEKTWKQKFGEAPIADLKGFVTREVKDAKNFHMASKNSLQKDLKSMLSAYSTLPPHCDQGGKYLNDAIAKASAMISDGFDRRKHEDTAFATIGGSTQMILSDAKMASVGTDEVDTMYIVIFGPSPGNP